MRILLVNSDRDEVGLFGEALKRVDRTIIFESAFDGTDALRYLTGNSESQPNLIVVDERGFFFLEKIRNNKEFSNISLTVYTTSTNPDDIDRTIACGASFLPKPTSYRELVRLLKRKIERLVLEA